MLGIIEPSHLEVLLSDIMMKNTENILTFINMARDYEAEMILDELTLYLKELLLGGNGKFSPMIIERFFRVIAESKSLLSLGSDGEFVLSLSLFKMMESLEIKDIDTMIRGLEKELEGVEISEIMVSSTVSDVSAPPKIITITEDEIVATLPKVKIKPVTKREDSPATSISDERINAQTESPPQTILESKILKAQTEVDTVKINPHQKSFDTLIKRIYDRDYDLGACFEKNITFESFEDNKLTWKSQAENKDKKSLITHWGVINMFVKECFGFETKIVNIPKKKVEKQTSPDNKDSINTTPHNDTNCISMIEDTEAKSSCIAPDAGDTEAAKEKDPSTLLQEPMVKEAIALFDPKKVRIKKNT